MPASNRLPRGPADLLSQALAADPSRPLVTFYNDATGERVELSVKTFDNWVAKTANLLVDGLTAEPGERVALALPPHWQTAVWLFACWSAGLVVVIPGGTGMGSPETDAPEIVAASERALPDVLADPVLGDAREIVGLSLHALGGPLTACPPGVLDYAVDVRAYGDHFVSYSPLDPQAPALKLSDGALSRALSGAELLTAANEAAARWGLSANSRVLSVVGYTTLDGLLGGLVAPLAAGGSVVICQDLDESGLERRLSLERVTAVAGVTERDTSTGSIHRLV